MLGAWGLELRGLELRGLELRGARGWRQVRVSAIGEESAVGVVKVLHHDRCFDGACSAALFTRFCRECIDGAAAFEYAGLAHRAGGQFDESEFTGDENAIVDFKYARSPRVTWWFDHHLSAFLTPEDEAEFERYEAEARASEAGPQQKILRQQKFFDPTYPSCTGWIAHVASTKFGMDVTPLAELIHWADIVDGAKYESAAAAVGMGEPAMQLTLAIESSGDEQLIGRLIPLLTEMPLGEIVRQEFVQVLLGPLLERHREGIKLIGERAHVQGGVLTFDITDQPTEGYNKFIPYFLHPEATYTVGLSRSSIRTKVAVGTNPWTTIPSGDLANIAEICERYGGGGHARVGAVSFAPEAEAEARAAAEEIVAELRGGGEAAG